MNKKELTELCDVNKHTITRMNNGENINIETLAEICNALKCSFIILYVLTLSQKPSFCCIQTTKLGFCINEKSASQALQFNLRS